MPTPELDPESGLYRMVGKVKTARLGFEDHGILTFMLDVEYTGNLAQGVGGFILSHGFCAPGEEREKDSGAYPTAGEWIIRLLRAFGVDWWHNIADRHMWFLWRTKDWWNRNPDGIENLPGSKGERFMFDDAGKLG